MFTSSGGIQIDMGVRRKKSRGEQSLILKVFFLIIGTSFKGRKAYNRVSIFRDKNKKKDHISTADLAKASCNILTCYKHILTKAQPHVLRIHG